MLKNYAEGQNKYYTYSPQQYASSNKCPNNLICFAAIPGNEKV